MWVNDPSSSDFLFDVYASFRKAMMEDHDMDTMNNVDEILQRLAPLVDQKFFVSVEGEYFMLNNSRYVPVGFNYYPRDHPWKMFEEWDPEEIRYELELGKSINSNALRIFLKWQPSYLKSTRDAYVIKVKEFLAIADSLGYKTIVTLFDGPLENFYNNDNAVQEYLEYFIPHFDQDTRILAWDLKNEPYWDFEWAGRENVINFLKNSTVIVKNLDGNHLITVGGCPVDLCGIEQSWEVPSNVLTDQYIPEVKNIIDFTSLHFYDGANYLVDVIPTIKNKTGKPVVIEEFSIHSWSGYPDQPMTEEYQKLDYENWLKVAFNDKASGLFFWTLLDFPVGSIPYHLEEFFENHMGIYRLDYSPKPVVSVIKEFYEIIS